MKTSKIITFKGILALFIALLAANPAAQAMQQKAGVEFNTIKTIRYALEVRKAYNTEWDAWLKAHDLKKLEYKEIFHSWKKVIAKYEQQCPFFLLGECEADFCPLTREHNPGYRKVFEDIASASLLKKIQSQPQTHYASFGSGGMIQDLCIIIKALTQKPDANIQIHLIDTEFTPYAAALDLLKNGRTINFTNSINLDHIMPQIVNLARTKWGASKKDSDSNVEKLMNGIIHYKEAELKQFITTLCKMFPRATFSCWVHASGKDYLDYIKQHQLTYPDIIAAADIQDEMSLLKRSFSDYYKLTTEVLSKKPFSENFLLKFSRKNQLVDIVSIQPATEARWPQDYFKDAHGNTYTTQSLVRIDLKNEAKNLIAQSLRIAKL